MSYVEATLYDALSVPLLAVVWIRPVRRADAIAAADADDAGVGAEDGAAGAEGDGDAGALAGGDDETPGGGEPEDDERCPEVLTM